MTIKLEYTIYCVIAILILLKCYSKIKHQHDNVARVVKVILGIVFISAVLNIVVVISDRYLVVALGYGLYYALLDWLCYFMVQYTCEYTKVKTRFLWVDKLWVILLCGDGISLIVNAFTRHLGTFKQMGSAGDTYWIIQSEIWYSIHLTFCATMLIETLLRLGIALYKSPTLYRMKYFSVLLMLMLVVCCERIVNNVEEALDISILFFTIGATILIHATFYFVPATLRKKLLDKVFHEMEDSLVMFDDKGNCVYMNNKWSENDKAIHLKKDEFDAALNEARGKKHSIWVTYGEDTRCYEDRYDVLVDEHGRYLGCYYIFRDITIEQELLHKQEYMAEHDELTGIYNRNGFLKYTEELLNRKPNEQFLIVCSDIRKFKIVNEILGIKMGDKILQLVATALRQYANDSCVYGRLGADNFVLCIPENLFDVNDYIRRMDEAIEELNLSYAISNHIGIYKVTDRKLSVIAMCDRALLAVKSVRDDYQQEVVYYDDAIREQLLKEQEVLSDIKRAFDEDQFVIYLQPQFSHKTHRIIGAEVLVRWIHPTKGIIPPNVFIPLLESNGLITKLNMHVWELACKQLLKWKLEGKEDMSVSVNISTKDFFYIDIYEVLIGLVKKYDVAVENLKLEITERAFTIDLNKQLVMIERLQNAGFIIEMDDFGSGYSSLNSLKDIPVDVLKMDMEFMSKSDRYKRSADILQMVVAMAEKLNMPVIAEGVETKEQADFLSEIGCDTIQGYYYAKPMPIQQFEEMLKECNG